MAKHHLGRLMRAVKSAVSPVPRTSAAQQFHRSAVSNQQGLPHSVDATGAQSPRQQTEMVLGCQHELLQEWAE